MPITKNINYQYVYSDRFFDFLVKSKNFTKNSLFNKLIELKDKQIEENNFKITYIDFSLKSHMVSFLSTSKINKLYNDSNKNYKINFSYDVWKKREEKKNSFWEEKRTETKVGRFLIKMLGDNINEEEIEEFVNLYKASHVKELEFLIVYGKDIIKYYDVKYHAEINYKSSLYGSCMNYSNEDDYSKKSLEFYSENPNVGLLILKTKNQDKITGRALIWKLNNGEFYIDRQYISSEHYSTLYKNYAIENKYNYYGESNYDASMHVESNEKILKLFKNYENDLPYLDTFNYDYYDNEIYSD